MSIFEYDEKKVRRVLREEAREEGYEEGYEEGKTDGRVAGRIEGRIEGRIAGKIEGKMEGKMEGKIEALLYLLEEKGNVPKALEERIKAETDENILRDWLKLAADAGNIEEFRLKL